MNARRVALLTLAVVAVSFAAIFIRLAEAPALAVAFYRNAIAAAVVLPLALLWRRDELRRLTGRQWLVALLSGALLALHFATWIASLSYTTVAASVLLVTSSPIFTALGARVFLGERVGRAAMLGIGLGLAGVAIVSGGSLGLSPRAALGDLLALIGGAAAAGYFLAGRHLRGGMSLLAYVAVVYTTCAALLLPMALLAGTPLTGFPAETWWMFVLLAAVPQLFGHTVLNYVLRDLDATLVAICVMGEPVGSALLAIPFFHEIPTWSEVAGGAALLAGIYVAVTAQAQELRARPRPLAVPLE